MSHAARPHTMQTRAMAPNDQPRNIPANALNSIPLLQSWVDRQSTAFRSRRDLRATT